MKKKKLILFNLSGTLLLPTEQVLLGWCKAIRATGLQPDNAIIFGNIGEDFKETVIPLLAQAGNWTELQKQTVIDHAENILHDKNLNCSLGLVEKIEQLKIAGYELGIITSHTSKYLSKRLLQIGLSSDIFKLIKTSDDDVKKPDPKVFDSALEFFSAEEIVFVGHCHHKDFLPAKERGVDFIAITSIHPAGLFEAFGVSQNRIYGRVTDFIDDMLKK